MARTQTMVQLTDDLLALLDNVASLRGVSRSAVIREAVSSYLADASHGLKDRQIIEGYQRVPPVTPDTWGSLEHAGDISTRETLQRLTAEERAAGSDLW